MKSLRLSSLWMALMLMLAGCATPVTEAPATQAPLQPSTPTSPAVFRVGEVTALGGINDRSFNAMAYAGIQRAVSELGVEGSYLESRQETDYANNIQEFLDRKTDLVITVGYMLGIDTAAAAKANPEVKFVIVDYAYPDCGSSGEPGRDCGSAAALANVQGLTFKTDEAAFLAGYLAAGMTKTGKVATFGGINQPAVSIFMKGFAAGVKYHNQVKSTSVEVLGWDAAANTGTFVGNFASSEDGRALAQSLVQSGADILMPVAGQVGMGSAAFCQESGSCWIVGVETDMATTAPEYESVILSSVVKNVDVAIFDTIQAAMEGTFQGGGVYVGTLANNGVDLAPYHSFESQIPVQLKAEIEQLKADIISGEVQVDG